jgi:hypothetical protein
MGQLCSSGEAHPVSLTSASAPHHPALAADMSTTTKPTSATITTTSTTKGSRPPLPHISSSPPPGSHAFPGNERSPKASEAASPRGAEGLESNDINIKFTTITDGNHLASPVAASSVVKIEPPSPATASKLPPPNESLVGSSDDVRNVKPELLTQATILSSDEAATTIQNEADRAQMLRLMSVFRELRSSTDATSSSSSSSSSSHSRRSTQPLVEGGLVDLNETTTEDGSLSAAAKHKAENEARIVARRIDKEKKAVEKKRRANHEAEALRQKWIVDDASFAAACEIEAKQIAPLESGVTFVRQWGCKGNGDSQFRVPIDIATGPVTGMTTCSPFFALRQPRLILFLFFIVCRGSLHFGQAQQSCTSFLCRWYLQTIGILRCACLAVIW